VTGLARAAEKVGVLLFESCAVEAASFSNYMDLYTKRGPVRVNKVLFATNAYSLELTGLQRRAESTFTLAVATQELSDRSLSEIGLSERKPFYTVDMPYLWGRLLGKSIMFGSGLLHLSDWRELNSLDVSTGEVLTMFERLEKRIRGFHPALSNVSFTHRWGGPICIAEGWRPVFEWHPESRNAIVLGAYSGHGVAQSVYLGSWAAEALLGKRSLPDWRNSGTRD
jgi:glycine/D-amino acid oxidase-like deaminating enzyme